ncbi:HAD family hydrolase [Desulfonema ishimotonii]|uniref:HAD family hydrolase n=2 Tax=Desulfonema ishimotonii TaxID=45657 RepID=A0A401FYI3_9BACT|nr:HAD family hydrolase [Desulfonema ishimotonii]
MKPFETFPDHLRQNIRYVLTDVDDTLTHESRLPSVALAAMERLQAAGIRVVPITGGPAGWCDHMARLWPVDSVIGESGAFYFTCDRARKTMRRRYWKSEAERHEDREKLERIRARILRTVPGCRVAADQAYRDADLAIDCNGDVPTLPPEEVAKIMACFRDAGARASVSSIHVNGWFGEYDKLAMTRILFDEVFGEHLDAVRDSVIYTGDAPNDCPMFAAFPHAVGVANILKFKGALDAEPAWITRRPGGYGFAEMADILLG